MNGFMNDLLVGYFYIVFIVGMFGLLGICALIFSWALNRILLSCKEGQIIRQYALHRNEIQKIMKPLPEPAKEQDTVPDEGSGVCFRCNETLGSNNDCWMCKLTRR